MTKRIHNEGWTVIDTRRCWHNTTTGLYDMRGEFSDFGAGNRRIGDQAAWIFHSGFAWFFDFHHALAPWGQLGKFSYTLLYLALTRELVVRLLVGHPSIAFCGAHTGCLSYK